MPMPDSSVDAIAGALEQSTLLVIRQLLDRREMSLTASDVLLRLDTDGPARLSTLATAAALSQPSMTQLVQRFERRGLVTRTSDPSDRRAVLITITDTGSEMVRQRRRFVRHQLSELVTRLQPDERVVLELASRVMLPLISRLNDSDHTPLSQVLTA
ncbi:MarR family winged helix-turn-helix transcriptional regulator [Mycobacterium sp. TKK-01-0059]|uniref:MarR family winged helix-turn-helix transcriptional regulator n=1 Tax=Mycobacterium sp. TKK-01-0059 TaxID=1324269 RepID=UPI00056D7093|nr:MarR family transcriptional regulator [Mycobacterium sp. TKK-01-0059]